MIRHDEHGVGHKVNGPGTQGGPVFGEYEVWATVDGEDLFVSLARTEEAALELARDAYGRVAGKIQRLYVVRVVKSLHLYSPSCRVEVFSETRYALSSL